MVGWFHCGERREVIPDVGHGLPYDRPDILSEKIQSFARSLGRPLDRLSVPTPRCLVPGFGGALFSHEWKDALWARFTTEAPRRQRQSVERYNIVKRA
ncbi:hypothetical protein GDI3855 [Gluconacetobacter diazotrophicus PA1 5]|uniref:Uncharacterized protein n=1 Tax=Gluconacetobacter diazotrophicus (strain ATCC 49037 / DSM 5601 / CCUG 37298 / CIP 103539 / LMG 7603 / PAl5) TaxID=272568 RepID=A9HA60_GLUDA|nr:hypothetical protein GDI3855 [Gluconacetobacter diazotrophicus PA1 5]